MSYTHMLALLATILLAGDMSSDDGDPLHIAAALKMSEEILYKAGFDKPVGRGPR
jgi:hypothetical protein